MRREKFARDDDGDGFCEVHVNTMEGFWSLFRSPGRPHRGVSQEKAPAVPRVLEFVRTFRRRGKALLASLVGLLLGNHSPKHRMSHFLYGASPYGPGYFGLRSHAPVPSKGPLFQCPLQTPCMREMSDGLGSCSIGPWAESVLTSLALEAAQVQPGTRPLIRPESRTIGWATSPHHKGGAATMGTITGQSVGIDISEDSLDVYLHPAGKEVRLLHNDEGTASLSSCSATAP